MVHTGHMATPRKSTREKLATQKIRLGGVREVAAELGVEPTNITTWMSRRAQNGCPEAVAQARMGSIFDLDEWVAWRPAPAAEPVDPSLAARDAARL